MAKETKDVMRQNIVAQALREISFARAYKQAKIANWQKNENLYYGKKAISTNDSRANIELGRMQEFVHTILSKIDNPLTFKYIKRKDSQLRKVARLNSLRRQDAQRGFWDLKDLMGKKQAIIYGRAIYFYYADSEDGKYCSHLDPVDVYDFLIDPKCGGLDTEKARYLGRYGVVFDRYELEENSSKYIKSALETLLQGVGNSTAMTQEEMNKSNRQIAAEGKKVPQLQEDDKFTFWEWFTTYKGQRYYLLINEKGAQAIQITPLTEMFSATDDFEYGAWPVWTWASFPDLTEFWTPGYCDFVREIFMAQATSVNQAVDNTEQVNRPQKVVNINAIEDEASLKYRKDGIIKTKGNVEANKAVQLLQVPSIDTPIRLFELLEGIQEKASGVTAAAKGVADTEGRAAIYKGNMQNTADRFGLLNKSYSFGYHRFAQLYEIGVNDHLTKATAIEIIGPEGIEVEMVKRTDIFRSGDSFSLLVESSKAEEELGFEEMAKKNQLLMEILTSPTPLPVNKQKILEAVIKNLGYSEVEARQLLDVNNFATEEVLSEADRDIEKILDGKNVKPNPIANVAYKQRFLTYMQDHEEDMSHKEFMALDTYIQSVEEYVNKNLVRSIADASRQQMMSGGGMPQMDPQGGIPPQGPPQGQGMPPANGQGGAPLPTNPVQ